MINIRHQFDLESLKFELILQQRLTQLVSVLLLVWRGHHQEVLGCLILDVLPIGHILYYIKHTWNLLQYSNIYFIISILLKIQYFFLCTFFILLINNVECLKLSLPGGGCGWEGGRAGEGWEGGGEKGGWLWEGKSSLAEPGGEGGSMLGRGGMLDMESERALKIQFSLPMFWSTVAPVLTLWEQTWQRHNDKYYSKSMNLSDSSYPSRFFLALPLSSGNGDLDFIIDSFCLCTKWSGKLYKLTWFIATLIYCIIIIITGILELWKKCILGWVETGSHEVNIRTLLLESWT